MPSINSTTCVNSSSVNSFSRKLIFNFTLSFILTSYSNNINNKPTYNTKQKDIPIIAFIPRRWKAKIVNDKTKIVIKNLNPSKRPISAVADNLEVRNAKSITVKTNNKIKFNLLYDKNRDLQKKIKIEQIRRETS